MAQSDVPATPPHHRLGNSSKCPRPTSRSTRLLVSVLGNACMHTCVTPDHSCCRRWWMQRSGWGVVGTAVLSSWPRKPSMLTGTAAPLPWPAVHKARGCLATACKAMFNMDPSDDDATLILEVSQPLALACASPPSCPRRALRMACARVCAVCGNLLSRLRIPCLAR